MALRATAPNFVGECQFDILHLEQALILFTSAFFGSTKIFLTRLRQIFQRGDDRQTADELWGRAATSANPPTTSEDFAGAAIFERNLTAKPMESSVRARR